MSIRFSLRSAKKPRCFESGDQKGNIGFSVPRKTCAAGESSGRIQIAATPSADCATIAIILPSGDIEAIDASKRFDVPGGDSISLYVTADAVRRRATVHAPTTTPTTSAIA